MNENNLDSWLFVTDRKNLASILSSCVVQTAANEFRHRWDLRDHFDGRLVFFRTLIPTDAFRLLKERGVSIPVVLRFNSKISEQLTIAPSLCDEFSIGFTGSPVTVEHLNSVEFLSDDNRSDSVERLDVLWGGWKDSVAHDPFVPFGSQITIEDVSKTNLPVLVANASTLDDVLGAICLTLKAEVSTADEINVIAGICRDLVDIYNEREPDCAWLGNSSSVQAEFDQWLWISLSDNLISVDSETGTGSVKLLEDLIDNNAELPAHLKIVAEKWKRFVQEILDGERDLPILDDTGSPIQRAALLFLLRRSPERLTTGDEPEIGWVVRTLAQAFSGCFCGFMGLEEQFKPSLHICLTVLQELLSNRNEASLDNSIQVTYEPMPSRMTTNVSLNISGVSVLSIDERSNAIMREIHDLAIVHEFDFTYDTERQEAVLVDPRGSKPISNFPIFVSSSHLDFCDDAIIRFEVCCKSFKNKTAIGKIPRTVLMRLLSKGAEKDVQCRYAISEERLSIVAIVDVSSASLTKVEFVKNVKAVLDAASSYAIVSKKG